MAAGNRGKMGDQNLVTGKHLSEDLLTDLRGGTETASPIQLTPADPPYYFMRIDGAQRLRDQAFPDGPTAPVSIAGWRQVRVKPGRLLEELQFLEGLGLAMVRPNSSDSVYLVSPLSSVLYAQGTGPVGEVGEGVFIRINTNRPEKALKFNEKPSQFLAESWAWGHMAYDLAAISCWQLGRWKMAYKYGKEAVKISPNDERLAKNLAFYKEKMNGNTK